MPTPNAGAKWKKSSRSAAQGCVEVAISDAVVLIRDSKDPGGPIVEVTREAWADLLAAVNSECFPAS